MSDDVEDLLERASRVRPHPVDPAEIWATGTKRRRTRRTVRAATTTLVVLALATPVGITAYRELSTPGVDVADTPDATPPAGSDPVAGCGDLAADGGDPVTRGVAAGVIAATLDTADVELPASPPDRFVDDDGTTVEEAINQLSAVGILQGTRQAPERFAPDDPLTRGQLSSLLVRSYELTTGDRLDAPRDPFRDDDGSPHESDNAKVAAADLLGPAGPDTFEPYEGVARSELLGSARRLGLLLTDRDAPRCTP